MAVKEWLNGEESAKEMLSRVLPNHLKLPPPLHRVPLRLGNVVEVMGSSPSAKTHILMQSAITCILPQHWNGVHYGGLGHLVMFIDLDCRFDILRFAQLLKVRIREPTCSNSGKKEDERITSIDFDEELFAMCMRRFLYIRCYDSLEFLATVKTLHYHIEKEREAQGISVRFLMIDSIGTFHWKNRASTSLHQANTNRAVTSLQQGANNGKGLFLQNVIDIVVQDIKKHLQVHPMLVFATKATILGNRNAADEVKRNYRTLYTPHSSVSRNVTSNMQKLLPREYMPLTWQSFVTYRIFIQATDDHPILLNERCNQSTYLAEYLQPPLGSVDNFVVEDAGVFCVS